MSNDEIKCMNCVSCGAAACAQLAAVEEKNRELEEQHAHDCDQFNRLAQEKADAEKDRAVANERVKGRHG